MRPTERDPDHDLQQLVLVVVGAVAAAILFSALFLHLRSTSEDECDAKGGVYLAREAKCVKGITEL